MLSWRADFLHTKKKWLLPPRAWSALAKEARVLVSHCSVYEKGPPQQQQSCAASRLCITRRSYSPTECCSAPCPSGTTLCLPLPLLTTVFGMVVGETVGTEMRARCGRPSCDPTTQTHFYYSFSVSHQHKVRHRLSHRNGTSAMCATSRKSRRHSLTRPLHPLVAFLSAARVAGEYTWRG